jgi:hypothetical protein
VQEMVYHMEQFGLLTAVDYTMRSRIEKRRVLRADYRPMGFFCSIWGLFGYD